jgi:hypothetical protein
VLRVNIVNPGMLGVRCSPTWDCPALSMFCRVGGGYLKFKTLDSLEAVFFFNSFNTGKWWSGTSIYFDGCLQTSHFLVKMEGDFYTPISHYSQPLYDLF